MHLLTPRTQAGRDMVARMALIAKSPAMQDIVNSTLPNSGETFEKISPKGLSSLRNDATIYTADMDRRQ